MSLKEIFFDMGGTIQNFWTNRELKVKSIPAFRDTFLRAGINFELNDEALTDLVSSGITSYHKWNRESRIELKPFEVWKKFVLKEYQFPDETLGSIAEDLTYLYETTFYYREMRPEIPEVLAAIKSMGLSMGIISNTQSQRQVPDNLTQYGIIDYFSPIVLTSQYGLRKPDPSIFYYAARLAKVPTGSCMYIGDKINRDILGARRAGFRSAIKILHIFDDGEPDFGATPDAEIENMTQLIPIIEQELEKDKFIIKIESNQKIKAVFFDAGDILYHRPQKQLNFNEYLSKIDHTPDPELDRKLKVIRELAFQGKLDRHDYYRQSVQLHGISDEKSITDGVTALDLDDDTVSIFEGVPETIKALKEKGLILGIITDTALTPAIKLKWFEDNGFGYIWDIIISSKDLGIRKPAPILYEEAITQAGIKPDEAIFVGHKATELEGARNIGLKTIAFNYEKKAIADKYIQSFGDLIGAVADDFFKVEKA
ncbi:MAG: hypothetical protein C0410_10925 [Anaerolinea sp.]|nr:hypothetical protein [Anaerolinea sp.]